MPVCGGCNAQAGACGRCDPVQSLRARGWRSRKSQHWGGDRSYPHWVILYGYRSGISVASDSVSCQPCRLAASPLLMELFVNKPGQDAAQPAKLPAPPPGLPTPASEGLSGRFETYIRSCQAQNDQVNQRSLARERSFHTVQQADQR